MVFRWFSTLRKLREYQQECIDKSFFAWNEGLRRIAVSLPVGSGKTVIFSNLIRKLDGKVLVLAHRKELLIQAFHQIQKFCPEKYVAMDHPNRPTPPEAQVIVASVNALGRKDSVRIQRYSPLDLECIIIDEV